MVSAATGNRQAVAGHLQSLWDRGADFDAGFAALAQVQGEDVKATFDALSGQALGLIGATRHQASLGFIDTLWPGCSATAGGGRCAWGQWGGTCPHSGRPPRHDHGGSGLCLST